MYQVELIISITDKEQNVEITKHKNPFNWEVFHAYPSRVPGFTPIFVVGWMFPIFLCLCCFVCLRSVSCAQCFHFLWIIHSWLPLHCSLVFTQLDSDVSNFTQKRVLRRSEDHQRTLLWRIVGVVVKWSMSNKRGILHIWGNHLLVVLCESFASD